MIRVIINPMKRFVPILSLGILLSFTLVASAQVPGIGEDASVNVSPANPAANATVRMEAASLRTDINRATITWMLNGKTEKKGIGEKTFQFQNGAIGKTTTVDVYIVTQEGQTIEKHYTFRASSIDIIWKANTYVPPFYKGKALPSYQSDTTFIALPTFLDGSGTPINPKSLVYTWKKDNTILGDQSGYGKQSLTVPGSIINRPYTIQVDVASFDNRYKASGSTSIQKGSPDIVFYENNPLYGVQFNRALEGQATINNQEISIAAYPYHFSARERQDLNLSYTWRMNGATISTDTITPTITFKTPGVAGTSALNLRIENTAKILQFFDKSLTVKYGDAGNASVF